MHSPKTQFKSWRLSLAAWWLAVFITWGETSLPNGPTAKLSTLNSPPADRRAGQPSTNVIHWAFRPLVRPAAPQAGNVARIRTPIDAFVLAKLDAKGLRLSPEADRATLLRRAYLDLIGLPPSPEEAAAFLDDNQPDAYERLVDQLLASPHFGERWGRHWLDWSGYVDVLGGDNDAGTIKLGDGKWRYRDYVIRAFNQDKPYDRFLLEQLAGDELVDWRAAATFTPEIKELLVATGFLRVSADDTDEDELNTMDIRHGVLQRTAEIVANNVLALTLQCAKCHDHKYDPITQQDYYRFLANFTPAFNPQSWLQPKQRALPDVSPMEKAGMDKHNAELEPQVNELKKRQADLLAPHKESLLETKLARLPEAIRADTKAAIQTPADKRSEVQKYLAGKFEKELAIKPEAILAALSEPDKATNTALDLQITELNSRRKNWQTLQAVYDVGPPSPTHLLKRGNHETPGEEVQSGFVSVLCGAQALEKPASRQLHSTSGRRLAFAQWLTQPDTPAAGLVARVMVNRVWQQLFGKGLVETSDNFGLAGAPPTHSELLDWLASELMRQQWQIKPLIKLILTSSVYRQASSSADFKLAEVADKIDHRRDAKDAENNFKLAEAAEKIDPGNQLLWRQRLRRLDSEIVRDAILAAGGKLDRTLGGPPLPLETRPNGLVVVKAQGLPASYSQWRRSVYVLARRNYHLSLLNVFDQPTVATSCAYRTPSAVVSQSLTMLNDAFVLEHADHFAWRIAQAARGKSQAEQIQLAFQIALARQPSASELNWSTELLQRQAKRCQADKAEQAAQTALTQLCHTLLNTSEFLYAP